MERIKRPEIIPLFERLPIKQHADLADIFVRFSYETGGTASPDGPCPPTYFLNQR